MAVRVILRAWWKSFLIITLIAFSVFFTINITNPSNSLLKIFEILGAGVATIVGVAGAWGWFDRYVIRRKQLIQQVLNQVPDVAKSAISYLNDEGYLHSGSLKGIDLRGARLTGVDLKAKDSKGRYIAANLENVNLKQAHLSSADMRGINLKGANLEITDLSNAVLIDANLREVRFTLTILKGANLKGADLKGAQFAGEICDESTMLPNGAYWNDEINWSIFGATEELPEYARTKLTKSQQTSDPLQYENVGQRDHDLELLARLWKKMNSDNIIRLDDDTQYRRLEDKFYTENFSRYLYERHEHSELRFISPILEEQFQLYDEALRKFDYQLFQSAGVEDFHGKQIVRPDYKLSGLDRDVQIYKEQEWEKTIDSLLELRRVHRTLVTFLKKHFPEFNFFNDSSG